MSGAEDDTANEEQRHKRFLVSMSEIGSSDGRFKLIHGNDGSSVSTSQAFADVVGTEITVDSLFPSSFNNNKKKKSNSKGDLVKNLKKSYNKTVAKNENLRLPVPSSTAENAKLARSATRERFAERMSRWDAAVHGRRAAASVSFPLDKPDLSIKTSDDRKTTFRTTTPLEREMAMLLHGTIKDPAASESVGMGLSVREAREKLKELAKIRAHERHHQLKMKRQNKIKSKRYRRQLRRERNKEMDAVDATAKAEVNRAIERASLKHTKASKNLHFVAKHADKNVKNRILGEKDKRKRDLKAKEVKCSSEEGSDDDDGGGGDKNAVDDVETDPSNPWTASMEMREGKLLDMIKTSEKTRRKEEEKRKNVDPDDFLCVQLKNGNFGDVQDEDDENSEDDEKLSEARNEMSEAFATDDDVLRDFKKEAHEKAKAKRAKNAKVSSLPGWGTWAGSSGIIGQKRKRQQPCPWGKDKKPREARQGGDSGYRVIINESSRGQSARSHQTSNIPFPFNSVRDFEASIRLPVGDTFIPRTSFKKLVKPKIHVTKGAVVEPMDRNQLVKRGIEFDEPEQIDNDDCGIF